jgi:hypothetical protein
VGYPFFLTCQQTLCSASVDSHVVSLSASKQVIARSIIGHTPFFPVPSQFMSDVLNYYIEPNNITDGPRGKESLLRTVGSSDRQVFPNIYGTPCVYYPVSQQPVTGSVPKSNESSPRSLFSRNTSILNSHLFLGLPSCPFRAGFPSKSLCTFLSSSVAKRHRSDKIEENVLSGTEF